jgi:hypothetical protein
LSEDDYTSGRGHAMVDSMGKSRHIRTGHADDFTKQIFVQFDKPYKINGGMSTICKWHGLSEVGTSKIQVPLPAPSSLFDMMFASGGYDPKRLSKIWGNEINPETLMKRYSKKVSNKFASTELNREMNGLIKKHTTTEIADKGYVGMGNTVGQVAQSKSVLRKESLQERMDAMPDCYGPIELEFRKYDVKTRDFADGYEPYTVTLTPHPGDTDVKLKHYYIFSKQPSWGKSYVLGKKLINVYKAGRVQAVTNACNLQDNVQFLVVDEYSQKRALELTDLKGLTSGDASNGCLNRKSFGDSYVPRPDMQMIVLSNHSPYDVYATHNKKYGRRFIAQEDAAAIEDRFHVHMLDGDLQKERLRWIDPSSLTREESLDRFRTDVAELVEEYGENVGSVKEMFDNIVKRARWYGLTGMNRDLLLDMLPPLICGGVDTSEVAAAILCQWEMKCMAPDKIDKNLTKLMGGGSKKRKRDPEDSPATTKRPCLFSSEAEVHAEMFKAVAMDDAERADMVRRCTPQLKRMLREELDSGQISAESSPYRRLKRLLKNRFGPEIDSMVRSSGLFTARMMIALE